MEEKKTVAKSEINVVSPSPENVLMVSHARRNLFIILSIAGVVFLSLGTYIYYLLFLQVKTPPLVSRENLTQPSPIPTAAVNAADFVPYNTLSGEEKFSVAYNFSDSILNTGFAYPPGYSVQSVKADDTYKNAKIFFLGSRSTQSAASISASIRCEMANREIGKEACTDMSFAGDVLVRIQPNSAKEGVYAEEKDSACRKEINTVDRVLFSCLQSDFSGGHVMRYVVYFLKGNPLIMEVISKTPKEQAHLIRSIISSATNHL